MWLVLPYASTAEHPSSVHATLWPKVQKELWKDLFEVLVKHLAAESHVVHTYAARAIERILAMKPTDAAPAPFGREQLKPQLQPV